MQYTVKQRVFTVEAFIASNKLLKETKLAFKKQFKTKYSPCSRVIIEWYSKFKSQGSVLDSISCRSLSIRTPEKITEVRQVIAETPTTSIRKVASHTNISYGTARRILRFDLHLFPYKVQLVQGLSDDDFPKRLAFCQWFEQKKKAQADILSCFIFTDEASFHLSGKVNRHNTRFWGEENPKEIAETKRFSPHLNIWVAITKSAIFGPYFFEEDNLTVTVNTDRYIRMLEQDFLPDLERSGLRREDMYFQHDNATTHTSKRTMEFLRNKFPEENLISKPLWPPRSPDLTPPDFYLFGYLKSKVYAALPSSLEELKQSLTNEINAIQVSTLEKVFHSVEKRYKHCIQMRGAHIQHLL